MKKPERHGRSGYACQKSLIYVLHQWILLVKGFPLRGSWQPQADG